MAKPYLRVIEGGPDLGPVTALGVWQMFRFFCDPTGQVRALHCNELTRRGIISLFRGDTNALERLWPGRRPGTWDSYAAMLGLMIAASRAGVVDPRRLGFGRLGEVRLKQEGRR